MTPIFRKKFTAPKEKRRLDAERAKMLDLT
jgi:hypothetical protein